MSPQQRPSPDRQHMLYSSHLKGMEQPVRSPDSSVRPRGNHASSDKPLPSIPNLRKISSSSSVVTIQSQFRSTGFSLWESPSDWDNGENSQTQSKSSLAVRCYSPIIPEPPEDLAAMQMDTTLWQLENGPFPQTPLDPIHERTAFSPQIPARNPSRLSLSLSNPDLTGKELKGAITSVNSKQSNGTRGDQTSEEMSQCTSCEQSRTDLSMPLDLATFLSHGKTKEKSGPSSSRSSLRDRDTLSGNYPRRLDSLQPKHNAHPDLRDNGFTTFRKTSILADDNAASIEDPETSRKTQAQGFAQDYHDVLAYRYKDGLAQHDEGSEPGTPPKDRDLTPRPLAWKKESSVSLPADAPPRPQVVPSPSSGRHRNLKKMGSWVGHHLKKDSHIEPLPKPFSMSEVHSQQHQHEAKGNRFLKRDLSLKEVVQHGKDLVSRKVLCRESEPKRPMVISWPIVQLPAQSVEKPPGSEAPFQLATPLFRLPGGLALVKNSPTSTPQPQTANASESPTSRLSESPSPNLPTPSQFHFDFSPRNSWQGTPSRPQSQDFSTTAIKSRLNSLISAPSPPHSFSHSTTSLPTPAPQDLYPPLPYNPPQTRRRSHNVGSPLTSPPASSAIEQRSGEIPVDAPQRWTFFEKAKSPREAWKKRQRDLKTQQLKQSIRLVGPADARGVAGWISCDDKVDGRASGDSGVGEGQLPGCFVGRS